jgi:hypothetical protein
MPGPNELLPCGTDSARRRHAAHGQLCLTCEPDAEWATRCPSCWRTAPIAGLVVQPHLMGGRGFNTTRQPCPGAGRLVDAPPLVDRPVWQPGEPRLGVVRVLAPAGESA